MIDKLHIVTVEKPLEYIWKSLRYLTDVNRAEGMIADIHKTGQADRANVRKQALQLGYCIRQAEEYFLASSQVGLATRPLQLYYGAMSLAALSEKS